MKIDLVHLGRKTYREVLGVQEARQSAIICGLSSPALFLVEHEPVLTLGASFHEENLHMSREKYEGMGISIEPTGRGGDVTFHGPGQLVAYPVFDLKEFGKDLHKWLRNLEEVFLQAIAEIGIEGRRFPPHTGVWVGDEKVAAIGVKVSKWVSIHGVALNCNNDLAPFETITPCGIRGYGVTSLSKIAGRDISIAEAEPAVLRGFASVFGVTFA